METIVDEQSGAPGTPASLKSHGPVVYQLIVAAALAIGLQSAANRGSGLKGVSTTYMTGTITRAVEAAVARIRPVAAEPQEDASLRGGVWLLYLGGAVAGAFAEIALHASAIAIPAALTVLVAALGWQSSRRSGR